MATYDFSSLYTTLPHNLIKEKLAELIDQIFNREGSLYLACNEKCTFFLLLNNLKDFNCGHVRKIVSEYDQEISQSQTADKPMTSCGRATHQSRDTRKTNKAKQPALSTPSR